MENDLLNAQEVALLLKISRNTVYELVKRGELIATRVGKQVRIHRSEIEKYTNSDKTIPAVKPPELIKNVSPNNSMSDHRLHENEFVISGQDISLDILANQLGTVTDLQIYRTYKGSYNGIFALYQRQVDLATAHLWDGDSNEYNVTYIKKMMPGIPALIMRIARRKQGFFVKRGNPKNIYDWIDLKRPDITIANRDRGSGSRVLLDEKLRLMGIIGDYIPGYFNEMKSGFAIADAVLNGNADVGIGSSSSVVNLTDIDFIELQEECFDLIIRLSDAEKEQYRKVLEVVSSLSFKQQLQSLQGYDTNETGKLIWR